MAQVLELSDMALKIIMINMLKPLTETTDNMLDQLGFPI